MTRHTRDTQTDSAQATAKIASQICPIRPRIMPAYMPGLHVLGKRMRIRTSVIAPTLLWAFAVTNNFILSAQQNDGEDQNAQSAERTVEIRPIAPTQNQESPEWARKVTSFQAPERELSIRNWLVSLLSSKKTLSSINKIRIN
jgi:hypothetical protein